MKKNSLFLILFASIMMFNACKKESKDESGIVNIRISSDPDALVPYLARSSSASQILEKLYLPLADFDPFTLALEPVLLTELPVPTVSEQSEQYQFTIRNEASWSDGIPVTADDVLFTLKLLTNSYGEFGSVRSTLTNIDSVSKDHNNPKIFTVKFNGRYHLDLEALTNLPILPQHVFDPQLILHKYPYNIFATKQDSILKTKDSIQLKSLVKNFRDVARDQSKIVSSGAYSVTEWLPGQKLTLKKNEQWWGLNMPDQIESLNAYPVQINYIVLPDEAAAMAALRSGQIDILPDLPPNEINALKNDEALNDKINTSCPDLLQYYYISINNSKSPLNDVKVRAALSHLVNVDQIIEKLMHGIATRTASPILPQKKYYNNNIKPVSYNVKEAKTLLDSAGYLPGTDLVRSKMINGKPVRLSFTLLTTGKQLGKDIATLFSEEAAKAGIEIKIKTMELSAIIQEVKKGEYDLANLAARQFPGIDDPYLAWHSSNAFGKGSNTSNFVDSLTDKLTEQIRTANSTAERNRYFNLFQERLTSLYPVIFLFTPKNCIAYNNSFDLKFSVKRPGYFENTIRKSENK